MRILECRELSTSRCAEIIQASAQEQPWLLVTAWQLAALAPEQRKAISGRAAVVVPDFLNYARLLNTGQAGQMLGLSGSTSRSIAAGLRALPTALGHPGQAAQKHFWLIAQTLLRYDLALLPEGFRGPAILHSYLTDFALAFDQRRFMEGFFRAVSGRATKAGISTLQLPAALSALTRWNLSPGVCVHPLSPASLPSLRQLVQTVHANPLFGSCSFWGDVSSLGESALPQAAESWDGLVVGAELTPTS